MENEGWLPKFFIEGDRKMAYTSDRGSNPQRGLTPATGNINFQIGTRTPAMGLSVSDLKELEKQIANVGFNVPRDWKDRPVVINDFVTKLVNDAKGGGANARVNLMEGYDPTELSSYKVTAGQDGTVSLEDYLGKEQAAYSSPSSLPVNPDTGAGAGQNRNPLNGMSEQLFWAAYDILNTKEKDRYRWGTQSMVSLPGTAIQNVSVDLAALLEVLPEANNVIAKSLPSSSGMGAGIAIQNASDSLKSVLEAKIRQEGGGYGTRPVENRFETAFFPVVGKPYELNDDTEYADRELHGGYHHGVDLGDKVNPSGKKDRSVFAPYNGKITKKYESKKLGNIIEIESYVNGVKIKTVYQHLDKKSYEKLHVGQIVKRGEKFVEYGDTGTLSKGPHLHFEVHINGTEVDPMILFQ